VDSPIIRNFYLQDYWPQMFDIQTLSVHTCGHQDPILVASLCFEASHTFWREKKDDVLHKSLAVGVVMGSNLDSILQSHLIQFSCSVTI
jgi:hypothetical protein